jgi:hypothetical protein
LIERHAITVTAHLNAEVGSTIHTFAEFPADLWCHFLAVFFWRMLQVKDSMAGFFLDCHAANKPKPCA